MTKSVVNDFIDRAIAVLVKKNGSDGFTYGEVEMRVRTDLGAGLKAALAALGESALRERIRRRARVASGESMVGTTVIHQSLFDDELAPIYPVKRSDGETVFKALVHLDRDEMSEVIADLKKQEKGINQHILALEHVQQVANGVWMDSPSLTVEEAQTRLFPSAAE
jgi:hypothetical protein